MFPCEASVCFSRRFTCRRSCGSLQPLWSRRERSLFFSFSGMNNIPSAGERAYQEANGKGREIAASVTDKSVAELVFLTAPWAAGKREQVHQSQARFLPVHTQTHVETDTARLHQEKFREKTDLRKVQYDCVSLSLRLTP